MSDNKPLDILLVEDNPADVRLTQEAFRDGKIRNNLMSVKDGVEALEFLRRRGRYADASRSTVRHSGTSPSCRASSTAMRASSMP